MSKDWGLIIYRMRFTFFREYDTTEVSIPLLRQMLGEFQKKMEDLQCLLCFYFFPLLFSQKSYI
jgi:hypothetical protein